MPALRSTPTMISLLSRPFIRITPRASASITSQHRFYAQQSYGGGEGDPKGDDPQKQGSNPSADLEHPGPPPPTEGQGSGGGPTKAGSGGHNGSRNESPAPTSKSPTGSGGSGNNGSNGAQPKIYSSSPPKEQSEDVKKHNREMDDRHGRAQNQVDDGDKDNVNKGFWKGRFSRCGSNFWGLMAAFRSWRSGPKSMSAVTCIVGERYRPTMSTLEKCLSYVLRPYHELDSAPSSELAH